MAAKPRKSIEDVNAEAGEGPIRVSSNRWGCYAHGCPCFAAIAHGNDAMICMFHSDVIPERWAAITTKLREFAWLADAARKVSSTEWISRTDNWVDWITRMCDEHGTPQFLPQVRTMNAGTKHSCMRDEREYPTLLAYRLNSWLSHEMRNDAPLLEVVRRSQQLATHIAAALPKFKQPEEAQP